MPSNRIDLTQNTWTQITTTDKQGEILHLSGDTQIAYVKASVIPLGYDVDTPSISLTYPKHSYHYDGVSELDFIWAYPMTSDASIVVYPSTGVGLSVEEPYFNGERAINTQSYTESNIKLGVQHEASVLLLGVTGGASNDTIWLTGPSPVILKSRSIGFSGSGVSALIFEGATYSGGTPIPIYNPNAINPVATEALILSGATITDEGIQIFAAEHLIGSASQQGKGSSTRPFGQEKIMKPNTVYLFRLTSLDAQAEDITSLVSWFEGEPDFPVN